MAIIKTKSHEFQLSMDLPTLIRVKKALNIDLVTKQGIEAACSSFLELAPIVLEAIRAQVQKLQLTDDQVLNELIESRSQVIDAWLAEMRDFFHRGGYVALARVAAAMVEIGKREEEIAAQLLDEPTAKALVDRSLHHETKTRRKKLDELLSALGDNESDRTHGQPLPSSQPSPASIPGPSL